MKRRLIAIIALFCFLRVIIAQTSTQLFSINDSTVGTSSVTGLPLATIRGKKLAKWSASIFLASPWACLPDFMSIRLSRMYLRIWYRTCLLILTRIPYSHQKIRYPGLIVLAKQYGLLRYRRKRPLNHHYF